MQRAGFGLLLLVFRFQSLEFGTDFTEDVFGARLLIFQAFNGKARALVAFGILFNLFAQAVRAVVEVLETLVLDLLLAFTLKYWVIFIIVAIDSQLFQKTHCLRCYITQSLCSSLFR